MYHFVLHHVLHFDKRTIVISVYWSNLFCPPQPDELNHLMQISHSITASRHLFDLLGRWWWWLCTIITENHRKVEILRNVVITKCCFNLYQILSGEQLFSNSLKLWNNKHLKVFSQLHIQPKHFYCSKYIFGSNSRQYHFLDFHLWLVCKDPTIFLFSSQVFKCVNSFFNCERSSL